MRRRLHCVIGSSLEHTAACGDVVERVKSIYVQMSVIWSAGHPLHQAVFFFALKKKKKTRGRHKKKKLSRKKKTEQKYFKKGGKTFFQKQNR